MLDFIAKFQSAVIGTNDENGFPFSSYAPVVYDEHRYYIFISDIARHAANLRREKRASLFFIEDESASSNIFARKRVSLQCEAEIISRDDARFKAVMQRFKTRFDPELLGSLEQMQDFNLHLLKPVAGEAVFGFGEAYTLGGEHMETLLPRRGGGHKKA
jgi:heme iron utilization protein